jgi:hypothetical protein
VERFYSCHSTNQGNKNKPKWSRIEESKHELEGRKQRTRRTQHELTNLFLRRTPEDTRRIRDLLPKRVLSSYTNSWISGPLSHKQLEVGKTLDEKMQMEEVREMEAPSSYLIGLLHIPNFASRYKWAKLFSLRA